MADSESLLAPSEIFSTIPQNDVNADGTARYDKAAVPTKLLRLDGQLVVEPRGAGAIGSSPSFVTSASWNLEFITSLVKIPNVLEKIGGGVLDIGGFIESVYRAPRYSLKVLRQFPDFFNGMDRKDLRNFDVGVQSAKLFARNALTDTDINVYRLMQSIDCRGVRRTGYRGVTRSLAIGPSLDLRRRNLNFSKGLSVPSRMHPVLENGALKLQKPRTSFQHVYQIRPAYAQLLAQVYNTKRGRDADAKAVVMPGIGHGLKNMTDLVHLPMGGLRKSVAPVRGRPVRQRKNERIASPMSVSEDMLTNQPRSEMFGSVPEIAQPQLARALDDYFALQARLPPSGATAFDPRLTPAWAGLKLPV